MPNFRKMLSLVATTLILILGTNAQAVQSSPQPAIAPTSARGVIVESVTVESEAELLGIKPGDIIDGWSTATEHGKIDSPFDFSWVEIEQKPRGPLSLEGHRGTERQSWKFVTDQFELKIRPIMRDSLLKAYDKGTALAQAGKVGEAAAIWNRAASETTSEDPTWLASWFLMHSGQLLFVSPLLREAVKYFEDADKRCPGNEIFARQQLLLLWAASTQETGDMDKEEVLYKSAFDLASQHGGPSLIAAKSLEGIALVSYLRDDLLRAREYLERSLQVRQQLAPNSSAVASSLVWLGGIDRKQGDLNSAQTLIERAATIDEKLAPHTHDMGQIVTALGHIAYYRGDLDQAEVYYTRSLTIDEHIGRRPMAAAAMLVNLGLVAMDRGDFPAAERYWREAAAISDELGPLTGVAAVAHNNLGVVLIDEDRLDEAEVQLQRAMDIHTKRKANNIRVADTLAAFGSLAYKRNDTTLAADYLQQTVAIQRRVSPAGVTLASALSDLGAVFLKTGALDKAQECFTEAAAVDGKLAPQSKAYGTDLAGLGSVRLRQGKSAEAAVLYAKAIQVLEGQMSQLGGGSAARSIFRVRIADYYRNYVALLVEEGKPEAALDLLERSRARTLLELLETAHADIRKGVDSALLAQQKSLRVDINSKSDRRTSLLEADKDIETVKAADAEISKLISQYEDVQARIRHASQDYAALTQPQPLTSRNIRRELLDPQTVLLEYSLGSQRSYVFAVTAESVKAYPLPPGEEIQTASVLLYQLLSRHPEIVSRGVKQPTTVKQSENALMESAVKLSEIVLNPVAAELRGKRIVVVADGALQYVPFSMLPDPETSGTSVTPLVVNHEVINLPSASVLAVLRRQATTRARPSKAVAVLADPVFDKDDQRVLSIARSGSEPGVQQVKLGQGDRVDTIDADLLTRSAEDLGLSHAGAFKLPRLRYTRQEADAIRAAVPGTSMLAALDFDASRATATSDRLSNYRIVHFATHALANSEHPELSGLVFSLVDKNGKRQDGFLQLKDIYNLNLPADLVVLSACETGLGKEINGEGLIGLTRGFMYAGATRVVASLWNVSDVATAQLMANFYGAMEKEKLSPAAALRSAQISMWKQKRWNSPYFWAAFQIQGDWK